MANTSLPPSPEPRKPEAARFHEEIRAIMTFSRILWQCAYLDDGTHVRIEKAHRPKGFTHSIKRSCYEDTVDHIGGIAFRDKAQNLLLQLEREELCTAFAHDDTPVLGFHFAVFSPIQLLRVLLGSRAIPEYELRYFAMRDIRYHYGCVLSDRTVHLFYRLAEALNVLTTPPSERAALPINQLRHLIYDNKAVVPGVRWPYTQAPGPGEDGSRPPLRTLMMRVLTEDGLTDRQASETTELFFECCRVVRHVRANYKAGVVQVLSQSVDVEYLISMVFGVPTGVRGLDTLFGGGGILLPDDPAAPFHRAPQFVRTPAGTAGESPEGDRTTEQLTGRTVLITGRSGTGKTLLSLKIAVEVARLGGLAWIMPLEQSSEECLYSMEAMRSLPDDDSIEVATTVDHAVRLLERPSPDIGAVIILRTLKKNYDAFLQQFEDNADAMAGYPLRLIIADPVNSVERIEEEEEATELRRKTVEMFRNVKQRSTNILFVTEETQLDHPELSFEHKIADTVIRLSVSAWSNGSESALDNYNQRFIEIRKSRLQREQRGEHPFSIVPGEGIAVYSSAAAVMAMTRQRKPTSPRMSLPFGLRPLERVLGPSAIKPGDVIVLHGAEISYKTPLGLRFLLSDERPVPDARGGDAGEEPDDDGETPTPRSIPRYSLMIAARDDEATVRYMLEQAKKQIASASRSPRIKDLSQIRICALPQGYVNSGYVLSRITDELERAERLNYLIDRVMVDDVVHWETNCPMIRSEETFGDTLVNLLHRHGVTSLFVCGDLTAQSATTLQRSIVHGAACEIQFDRFVFRGIGRTLIRVVKTRSMGHRKESFELSLDPEQGLEILPGSSRLRVTPDGHAQPVNLELFLHQETDMQNEYNKGIAEELKAVTSRECRVVPIDRSYLKELTALGTSSAVDELQLLQIDEFQLPDQSAAGENAFPLYVFDGANDHRFQIEPCVAQMHARIHTGGGFFAVPFYDNPGLLAYRRSDFPHLDRQKGFSWPDLAARCRAWEQDHPVTDREEQELFFDFPRGTYENYNSLFLEMLLTFDGAVERLRGASAGKTSHRHLNHLAQWDEAVEAALLFRHLCRRAHRHGPKTPKKGSRVTHTGVKASIWRHWYTTVNQMLKQMPHTERAGIEVTLLPGNVNITGQWYLAVPVYSAAPDVGLEIIRMLTSRESELDRLRKGVGLPVRKQFYEQYADSLSASQQSGEPARRLLSPYFALEHDDFVRLSQCRKVFSRSEIPNYVALSPGLGRTLQNILEFRPPRKESEERQEIVHLFRNLQCEIDYLR